MKTILKYIFYLYHLPMAILVSIFSYRLLSGYVHNFVAFWHYEVLGNKKQESKTFYAEDEGAYAEDDVE